MRAYRKTVEPTTPIVHSITDATEAHSQDMDARIRRYLFSMAVRTICVVLVLVVHNPVRWVFAVLAVILPYVAVVMANAAGNRRGAGARPVTPSPQPVPVRIEAEKPVVIAASPEQTNPQSHEQTA